MRTLALILCALLISTVGFGTVVLSHFEATPSNHRVDFHWGTSSETNNYFFEIWRNDSVQAQVQGHGTTTQPQEYTWSDPTPVNETRYRYKLTCADATNYDTVATVIVIPPHWVAIGSFVVHGGPRQVQLTWVALSEINNLRFEISRNGDHINTVNGHGNSNVPHSYSWTDTSVTFGATYNYVLWAVNFSSAWDSLASASITLAAGDGHTALPDHFQLSAFPNPFNPTTTLSFTLPAAERLRLAIYDITGRERQILADDLFSAGDHRVDFDASALPSGVYVARLIGPRFSATQKLLLLK